MSAEASAPVESATLVERPAARRACIVVLGGRPFAVDVVDTREVVVLDATTPVPGAPSSVVGVMNLRGTVLPVIEARPLLGLAVRPAVGAARALVLADDANQRAAILIERVLGLAVFENVNPPADGVSPGDLVVGDLVDEAGDRATVLDAAALLRAVRRAWDSTTQPSHAVPSAPEPVAPARTPGA